ncbi:MAG: PPC domain-containing protein [Deltaproteobacteria bacterium]|nr:PPC domain-containing protein [Deltaproteobacteria bacterium]
MTSRSTLSLLLIGSLGFGCGDDDDSSPDAGPGVDMSMPDDAATDMPEPPDLGEGDMWVDGCQPVSIGAFELDVISDTGIRVRAPIDPELDEVMWGLDVWFQRFGGAATEGTIELGAPPNDDFPDCPHCVVATKGTDLETAYFAYEGTMELREDPFGPRMSFQLRDVILREVTIGPGELPGTISATPVEDGHCLALPLVDVDSVFPPDEWTCDISKWADGETCDCACGTWDPDCFRCDEFPPDPECDPTPLPLAGCGDSQVCSGFDAACYRDCSDTGTCGFGTCVYWLDGQRICETDTDLFDNAALGEACDDPFGLTYCAEDVGVANGVCAQWVGDDGDDPTWTCRPVCTSDSDCGEFEYCEMIFRPSAGYCLPARPPSWTCHPSTYEDGTCHCGCGAWDPDCGLTFEAPPAATGCADGDVCVLVDEIRTWAESECVTPPTNDTCATAEPVTLPYDQVVQTRGAAPDYAAESCFPSGKGGVETVYAITLEVGQTLSVTATPTNDDDNPAIYLVGPGDPSVCDGDFSCVAAEEEGGYGEPESFQFTATEAGTYYLMLDFFANRWLEVRLQAELL